nr:hypothetical protein [Candidatus Sigynarchaeum springense]MDO8118552.1 hypothetical protein [Candidatus Sigynarchaeota archaeon]
MHLNAHLAFGTAVTLLLVNFLQLHLSFLEVAICIAASFVVDTDIVLLRFARHKNHRLLPTHSMLLPFALIVLSACFLFLVEGTSLVWAAWTCAINVLVHDVLDSIDWGLNFFANGKIVGKKVLLGGKTPEEFYAEAQKSTSAYAIFCMTYYKNPAMKALEVTAIVAMCIVLAITWPGAGHEQWWTMPAYAALLCFHVIGYRRSSRPKLAQPA